MVVEPWILKMGNQVSSNLKHALYLENSTKISDRKQVPVEKQTIGILSFEVANVMSKIIHLQKSLTETEILKLKNNIFKSEGIRTLVSSDERQLLDVALAEKLDDLNRVAGVVSRFGKKCTIPALQGFEHVYGDIISGTIDVMELSFLVKDMESMIRKMERYVNSTASLYTEMEVMNELEVATKKFLQNQLEESRKAFELKLTWQKQDVNHLKDVSLWNQTYDKVVELLARTVCTIYARMHHVFGDTGGRSFISNASVSRSGVGSSGSLRRVDVALIKSISSKRKGSCTSGPTVKHELQKKAVSSRSKLGLGKCESVSLHSEDFHIACGMGPRRLLMECLSLSSPVSTMDDDDQVSYDDQSSQISGVFSIPNGKHNLSANITSDPFNGDQRQSKGSSINRLKLRPFSELMLYASTYTVGGSALALHYANVIIVIEKLLRYPHLVGEEARDDLYQMLPTSLRKSLKRTLKSYKKDVAIYDAPLAHDWKERLDLMLKWLAPLAHNMIRWQSERNFEQHQIVTRTNTLLLQTLYFADRDKTETAICELLVGLNYICRYEQQQNALLDCASSFDFEEDCMVWQAEIDPPFHP